MEDVKEITRSLLSGSTVKVIDNGDNTFTVTIIHYFALDNPFSHTKEFKEGQAINDVADKIEYDMNQNHIKWEALISESDFTQDKAVEHIMSQLDRLGNLI